MAIWSEGNATTTLSVGRSVSHAFFCFSLSFSEALSLYLPFFPSFFTQLSRGAIVLGAAVLMPNLPEGEHVISSAGYQGWDLALS